MKIKNPSIYSGFSSAIILSIVLVILSVAAFALIKVKTDEPIRTQFSTQEQTKKIDTSEWLTYPTEGSYTGWTIKHPAEHTPLAVQNDSRISIINGNKEAILMILKRSSKYQQGTLQDHLNIFKKDGACKLTSEIEKTSINDYDTYKFTSDCSSNSVGDAIFFKEKTSYIIVSPYQINDYLNIEVYTDKDVAQKAQTDLIRDIINTVTILKPEL